MNYTIRKAEVTENDFKGILELLITYFVPEHRLGDRQGTKADLTKALPAVAETLQHMTWVAETDEGEIIGTLGLRRAAPWYTSEEHYADMWFYIRPDWRKTHMAKDFLKVAKEFAKTVDVPVVLGIFNADDSERKIKLLQRMGLKLVGGTFYIGD